MAREGPRRSRERRSSARFNRSTVPTEADFFVGTDFPAQPSDERESYPMLTIYHWEPNANSGKPILDRAARADERLLYRPAGRLEAKGRAGGDRAFVDYAKYIEAFNTGDDAALVQKFFTEDCVFQSGPRFMRGRDELLKFLNWAHDGIRELIRAQLVLRDENHIFAEIDMDFHATRDRPDFTFGALKQGEFTTVKFFVVYYLRGRQGRASEGEPVASQCGCVETDAAPRWQPGATPGAFSTTRARSATRSSTSSASTTRMTCAAS